MPEHYVKAIVDILKNSGWEIELSELTDDDRAELKKIYEKNLRPAHAVKIISKIWASFYKHSN